MKVKREEEIEGWRAKEDIVLGKKNWAGDVRGNFCQHKHHMGENTEVEDEGGLETIFGEKRE